VASASSIDGGLRCVLTVGSAYLIQGLVATIGVYQIGQLVQLGTPLETQVGILASGSIPWVLKFVLALLFDLGPSWSMRTRALLLTCLQACTALGVFALAQAWATPNSLLMIAAGWIALNTCVASMDVLVDALALDTLSARRAATATAMGVGFALGAGVLGSLIIAARIGSQGMSAGLSMPAWWIAGLAVLPVVLLWGPERPTKAREQLESRAWRSDDLGRFAWMLLAFVLLLFAANVTQAVGALFVFDRLAWEFPADAAVLTLIAAVTGLIGAFACGPLVAKLGPAWAAMISSVLLGLVWLTFATTEPLWSQRFVILTLSSWEGLLQPALLVGLHALALAIAARTPIPTTAFVLAMGAINLPRVLAPLVAPRILELGWVGLFVACGLLQVVASAGIWPLARRAGSGSRP
jgi:hypothetical protein